MTRLSLFPRSFTLTILLSVLAFAGCVQSRPLLQATAQNEPVQNVGVAAGARSLLQIPPGNFELLIGETYQLNKYGRGAILNSGGVETWAMTKQIVTSLQSGKKGQLPSAVATFRQTSASFPPANSLDRFTEDAYPPPQSFQMDVAPPSGFTAYVGKTATGVYAIWDPNLNLKQGTQALTGSMTWYYGMTTKTADPGAVPLVSITDGLTLNLAQDVGHFTKSLPSSIVWCRLDQAVN